MNPIDVFDQIAKFSDAAHRKCERDNRLRQLREWASERCGNCDHWMKSSECPREERYRHGKGQIVSVVDVACKDFAPNSGSEKAAEELRALLCANEENRGND